MWWLRVVIPGLVAALLGVACHDSAGPSKPRPARLDLSPPADTILPGESLRVAATVRDGSGHVLSGIPVRWESSNARVLTVDDSGLVHALRPGAASVIAQAGDREARAHLAVGLRVQAVSAGYSYYFALGSDGQVWWGAPYRFPMIGRDSLDPAEAFFPHLLPGGQTFSAIAAGGDHGCGLSAAGEAYCWGENSAGQLGDGTFSEHWTDVDSTPVRVAGGLRFRSLALGGDMAAGVSCGLTAAGEAWCWGGGGYARLGDGGDTSSAVPVRVAGDVRFSALAVGGLHSCGLDTIGQVYCWGADSLERLGIPATDRCNRERDRCVRVPRRVPGAPALARLTAGGFHTCGLTADGATWCWGHNAHGELGDGTTTDASAPRPAAPGHSFVELVATDHNTCGLSAAGEAWCWGSSEYGQLGGVDPSPTPVLVSRGVTVQAISMGKSALVAITTAGTLVRWGRWPTPFGPAVTGMR